MLSDSKRLIACINSATGLPTVKAGRFATIMLTGGMEGLARTVLDVLGGPFLVSDIPFIKLVCQVEPSDDSFHVRCRIIVDW
jgi:hypothetical protein